MHIRAMHHIPPKLLPPEQTPPIRTLKDMHRQWRAFMGELGFGSRMLWFTFLTGDGALVPTLQRIEDLPVEPSREQVELLIEVIHQVEEVFAEPDISVAILLSRPGTHRLTSSDRAWFELLREETTAAGITTQPMFLACDTAVVPSVPADPVGGMDHWLDVA